MGLLRLVVFGFLGLSILYLLISFYSRSVRLEKLEKEWEEDKPEGADEIAREVFLERGMAEYKSSLRPKLILLVYVVPIIFVILSLILRN